MTSWQEAQGEASCTDGRRCRKHSERTTSCYARCGERSEGQEAHQCVNITSCGSDGGLIPTSLGLDPLSCLSVRAVAVGGAVVAGEDCMSCRCLPCSSMKCTMSIYLLNMLRNADFHHVAVFRHNTRPLTRVRCGWQPQSYDASSLVDEFEEELGRCVG